MSLFNKAERKRAKLKIALTGPSGAGKTYSALLMAKGFGGKVAVIDTEKGSASLYAGNKDIGVDFDVLEIEPPFRTKKYIQAMQAAIDEGYDTLIVDSITHAWAGEGGLLQQKEEIDAAGRGNSYTNWAKITKDHEAFMSAILQLPINMIVTMRSKMEYVLEQNDKGRAAPKRVGMAPVQRDGVIYEFSVVYDIAINHMAQVSKDRTGIYDDTFFKITADHGRELIDWINTGTSESATNSGQKKPKNTPKVSKNPKKEPVLVEKPVSTTEKTDQILHIQDQFRQICKGYSKEAKLNYFNRMTNLTHFKELDGCGNAFLDDLIIRLDGEHDRIVGKQEV
jgi:hypothetical protein